MTRRGFTVIELIVVIVITGILAGVLARFLGEPVRGWLQVSSRALLVDQADLALRRIATEVQRALPNSVRVACAGRCLEILRTVDGGMYRAQVSGLNPADDPLDFTAPDQSFDVLGDLRAAPAAGAQVVVYNLGSAPSDAYAGGNRASIAAGSSTARIVLTAPTLFPFASPRQRFHVLGGPVSFLCDPLAGTLRRNAGYPIAALQPTATNVGDPLANRVTACNFSFDPGTATRGGLLTLTLSLADGEESVTLLHQVHVFNAP